MSIQSTTVAPVNRRTQTAWPVAVGGAALVIIGAFLSWSYDSSILGDLSINFYPGGLQILAIIPAVLALVLLMCVRGPLANRLGLWLDAALGLRALGIGLGCAWGALARVR